MKAILTSLIVGLTLVSSYALTPAERKIVQHARTELNTAQSDYQAAKDALATADQRALDAEAHAADTDKNAATLKKQSDAIYAEAEALKLQNDKWKPIITKVNRWWGIGGILYGFGDLMKHLLILTAVLIGGAIVIIIVLLGLELVFPEVGVVLRGVSVVVRGAFGVVGGIVARLKTKPPTP